jgi:hypothetical protein
MKKILAMILIPFLSMYFVTIDTYEEDMAELENRIIALEEEHPEESPEGIEQTYIFEGEKLTAQVTYIIEYNEVTILSAQTCFENEPCEHYGKDYTNMSEEKFIATLDTNFEAWDRFARRGNE